MIVTLDNLKILKGDKLVSPSLQAIALDALNKTLETVETATSHSFVSYNPSAGSYYRTFYNETWGDKNPTLLSPRLPVLPSEYPLGPVAASNVLNAFGGDIPIFNKGEDTIKGLAYAGTRPVTDNSFFQVIPDRESDEDYYDLSLLNSDSPFTPLYTLTTERGVAADDGAPCIFSDHRDNGAGKCSRCGKTLVSQLYFVIRSSSNTILRRAIPDTPYFVFNIAITAPGGPSGKDFNIFDGKITPSWVARYGGTAGAGAVFTAILSTKETDEYYYVHPVYDYICYSTSVHRDSVKIGYMSNYEGQSFGADIRSSRQVEFSEEGDGLIDMLEVRADTLFHSDYAVIPFLNSTYLRLPGGYSPDSPLPVSSDVQKFMKSSYVTLRDARSRYDAIHTGILDGAFGGGALICHQVLYNFLDKSFSSSITDYPFVIKIPQDVFNPEGMTGLPLSTGPGLSEEDFSYIQNCSPTSLRSSAIRFLGQPSIRYGGPLVKSSNSVSSDGFFLLSGLSSSGVGGGGSICHNYKNPPTINNYSDANDGGPGAFFVYW